MRFKIISYLFIILSYFGIGLNALPAIENATQPTSSMENEIPLPSSLNETSPLTTDQSNENNRFFHEFFNMLLTLGLIILIILVVGWLLKRLLNTRIQQMNTSSLIKILERRSLSPKSTLYLLNIQGKEIAIAETQQGITLLGELSPKIDSSSPTATENKNSFNTIFEQRPKKE